MMITPGVYVQEFDLTQVSMVSDPINPDCFMNSQGIVPIDKYDMNINLLENHMNEQDIADVRDVIEDVMTDHLFELADQKTMNAIAKEIGALIHVDEFYDYLLEATVDQDSIVIDLCVKPTDNDDFTYFTASYVDSPAISSHSKERVETLNNFDRAMKCI